MWDEEGLGPIGGPGMLPCDSYDDSELNSMVRPNDQVFESYITVSNAKKSVVWFFQLSVRKKFRRKRLQILNLLAFCQTHGCKLSREMRVNPDEYFLAANCS